MRKKNVILRTLLLIVFLGGSSLMAEDRVLFSFENADAAKQWQSVNDGVMGGRSDGRFKINEDKNMEFFGTLSLENNGGFASVRSREAKLGLEEDDSIVIRVRGDGRDYNFRLNVPRSVSRNSYRQSFKTKKNEWIEVTLPMDKFVATWRGRVFPNEKFDPSNITGMGIQLSDKEPGPFKLEVESIKVGKTLGEMFKVLCEGTYPHHLQGVCTDEKSIYWSFTTTLVKTDMEGTVLKKIPVANHHGDLCFHDGKFYVAVNLGKFNDPEGNADSWIYVYDAESGHTHLGIQTATFSHGQWWFGCYGDPKILLVTDADFQMKGRHEIDCSLGIEGMTGGRLLVASGRCEKDNGCTGGAQTAFPDEKSGLTFRGDTAK